MTTKIDTQDILNDTIIDTDISSSFKDGLQNIFSLRTLGTGSFQASSGDIRLENFVLHNTASNLTNSKLLIGQGATTIINSSSFVITRTVFGSEYLYTESLSRSTNSTLNWTNKLVLTASNLSGTYRIGWGAILDTENQERAEIRLLHSNSGIIIRKIMSHNLDDGGANFIESSFRNLILSQSNIFMLQWRSASNTKIVGIVSATMEFWRVL